VATHVDSRLRNDSWGAARLDGRKIRKKVLTKATISAKQRAGRFCRENAGLYELNCRSGGRKEKTEWLGKKAKQASIRTQISSKTKTMGEDRGPGLPTGRETAGKGPEKMTE